MGALKQQPNQSSNSPMAIVRPSRNVIDFDKSDAILTTLITQYHSHFKDSGLRDQKRIKDLDKNLIIVLVRLLGFQLNAYKKTYQKLDHIDAFKLKKSYNHLSANVSKARAAEDLAKIDIDISTLSEKQLTNVLKKFSGKTVGRHLHHLEALDLLKIDKYGCQNRYLINPFLLHFTKEHQETSFFLKAEYQLIKKSNETNCPSYKNSKRIINLLTSSVEMITPSVEEVNPLITKKVDEDSLQIILKEPKAIVGNDLSNEYSEKNISAGATEKKVSPGELKRKDYIKQFAIIMWALMFKHLYTPQIEKNPKFFIAPSQKQLAIDYFETEAYKFQNWKQLENFKAQTRKRLSKWYKHTTKIEGFTPLPSNFFASENLKGYAITKFWLQKDFKHRVWLKQNTNVDNALLDIKHVLNGKSNFQKKLNNGNTKAINRRLNYTEIINYINHHTDRIERFCSKNGRNDLLDQYRTKLSKLTQAADWAKINEWQPDNTFEKQVTELKQPEMQVKYSKSQPKQQVSSPNVPKEERVTTEQLQKLNGLFNVFGNR